MITDALLRPSNAQAVTVTALSDYSIDLGVARDIARGEPMRAIALVTTAFAGGTSIAANLVESDNADLSSSSVLVSGAVVVTAAAIAGKKLADVVIPTTSKRYVGFNYVVVGTHTAGKVTSFVVLDTDSGAFLPANTGF